jgi:p-aminobenzoyl-glutamate transporter AbgT
MTHLKTTTQMSPEIQRDLFLYAQKRIKQKKWLYYHLIVMILGIICCFVFNKFLNYAPQYNWYAWVATTWILLWLLHAFNVFVTHRFMGPEWEKRQMDSLVAKQQARLEALQQKMDEKAADTSTQNPIK